MYLIKHYFQVSGQTCGPYHISPFTLHTKQAVCIVQLVLELGQLCQHILYILCVVIILSGLTSVIYKIFIFPHEQKYCPTPLNLIIQAFSVPWP